MDKLIIESKLMKTLIAQVIKKTAKKKLGYLVNVELNELNAKVSGDSAHVHINIDVEMPKEELGKIINDSFSEKLSLLA